jgi:acyl carrier protein
MSPFAVQEKLNQLLFRSLSSLATFNTNFDFIVTLVPVVYVKMLFKFTVFERIIDEIHLKSRSLLSKSSAKIILTKDKSRNIRISEKAKSRIANTHTLGREDISDTVQRIILSLLGTSAIPLDVPLVELGLDSLASTELLGRLNTEFNIKLRPTFFLRHPTVNKLIDSLFCENVDEVYSQLEVPVYKGFLSFAQPSSPK